MKIETKFEIGERVYYFNGKRGKVCMGKVDSISFFISEGNVGEVYNISPEGEDRFCMPESVRPSLLFKDREAVFEFCYKLTEGI